MVQRQHVRKPKTALLRFCPIVAAVIGLKEATDMNAVLIQLGFEVTLLSDVSPRRMDRATTAFSRGLCVACLVSFISRTMVCKLTGIDDLIPYDATIDHTQDIRYEAMPRDKLIKAIKNT